MPYSQMHRLVKNNALPQSLGSLETLPICPSHAFGSIKRRLWRMKDKYGKINKSFIKNPVASTELISLQAHSQDLFLNHWATMQGLGYRHMQSSWILSLDMDIAASSRMKVLIKLSRCNKCVNEN